MQVPPATHPAWPALLAGKARCEPTFLAARMLIVRCRMELVKGSGPDKAKKFVAELRELYASNADCASAQQDLARIFG
jgi:hypothetical protein